MWVASETHVDPWSIHIVQSRRNRRATYCRRASLGKSLAKRYAAGPGHNNHDTASGSDQRRGCSCSVGLPAARRAIPCSHMAG